MKDMHSLMTRDVAIGNATLSADNAPPAIDLQGFDAAEILLDVGVGGITFTGSNKIEVVVTHSDDNSVYTNVTDADILGASGITNGIVKSFIVAHPAAAAYRFGYIGNKRYLKVLADFSGTHGAGTPIAASVVKMRPRTTPTPNQA